MTNRSDPPGLIRPPLTLQSLMDRIAAADLDPVQIASMDLHLSHLLRVREDWVVAKAGLQEAAPGIAPTHRHEAMLALQGSA